jgi:hypothetical protein
MTKHRKTQRTSGRWLILISWCIITTVWLEYLCNKASVHGMIENRYNGQAITPPWMVHSLSASVMTYSTCLPQPCFRPRPSDVPAAGNWTLPQRASPLTAPTPPHTSLSKGRHWASTWGYRMKGRSSQLAWICGCSSCTSDSFCGVGREFYEGHTESVRVMLADSDIWVEGMGSAGVGERGVGSGHVGGRGWLTCLFVFLSIIGTQSLLDAAKSCRHQDHLFRNLIWGGKSKVGWKGQ